MPIVITIYVYKLMYLYTVVSTFIIEGICTQIQYFHAVSREYRPNHVFIKLVCDYDY